MSANEHLEPGDKVAAPSSSLHCSTQSGFNTSVAVETSARLSPPPARSFRARSPSEIIITTDPEVLRSEYHHAAANRTSASPSQRPTPGPSQQTLEDTAPSMGIRGVDSTVDDHTPSITRPRTLAAEPSSSATHATHALICDVKAPTVVASGHDLDRIEVYGQVLRLEKARQAKIGARKINTAYDHHAPCPRTVDPDAATTIMSLSSKVRDHLQPLIIHRGQTAATPQVLLRPLAHGLTDLSTGHPTWSRQARQKALIGEDTHRR
ncbi:hypothetical protein BGW42_002501 [Actinomortierella wolfii]|nr:hypothetical protein BGW42_002501 [Actinomortierella wolfii]